MTSTIKRNYTVVEEGKISYDLLNNGELIATLSFPDTVNTDEIEKELMEMLTSLDTINDICIQNSLEPVDYTKITGIFEPEAE